MTPSSQPRADAVRNREILLAAATRAFAAPDEEQPSMRAIARAAGVGMGTLYRHFPTREALIDAIYQDQAARLSAGARELLEERAPAEAMRRWMDLFGEWLTTKQGMLGTLVPSADPAPGNAHPQSRAELLAAITALLDAGAAAGDLRTDVTAEDVSANLVGIFLVAGDPAQHAQAARLLDLFMDALSPAKEHR